MEFLKRLFSKKKDERIKGPLEVCPADWRLTTAVLMEEMKGGKRKSISRQELEWAKDYERTLIPDNARFPKKGDVYESLTDQSVEYMTAWAAPYTGGGEGILLKGEQIWIHSEPRDEKPVGAYAEALDYERLEQRIVPKDERESPKYGGFYFYITTVDLNDKFRLVKTGHIKLWPGNRIRHI